MVKVPGENRSRIRRKRSWFEPGVLRVFRRTKIPGNRMDGEGDAGETTGGGAGG